MKFERAYKRLSQVTDSLRCSCICQLDERVAGPLNIESSERWPNESEPMERDSISYPDNPLAANGTELSFLRVSGQVRSPSLS